MSKHITKRTILSDTYFMIYISPFFVDSRKAEDTAILII